MSAAVSVQDQDQPPRRTCLGTIATAHGVRGLVKIRCEADDSQLLNGTLYTSETGQDTLHLTMKNSLGSGGGKYWLAEVDGITDRDAALALNGTKLWIDRNRLPAIEDEDEFYLDDLIGLKVQDSAGNAAGKIIAVDNFGAGDLLEIQPPQGGSYHLPFTKKNVPAVLLEQGMVTIAAPDMES